MAPFLQPVLLASQPEGLGIAPAVSCNASVSNKAYNLGEGPTSREGSASSDQGNLRVVCYFSAICPALQSPKLRHLEQNTFCAPQNDL